uniref:P1 protein n=1 Tax=Cynanchum yellow mottle-associated virus TaxID=2926297 RepID=A0AA48GE63_9VIRU|nr:P1 protein [Cynanchum yellow mottle-associated virus]
MRNMAFITLILISLVTISSPYSSFGGFMAWEKVTSFSLENATWPSFNGASYSGSSPTSQTTKTEHSPLSSWTSQCPDPGVTIESSYSDILELLQRKFSLQIQNTSAGVLQLLKESYQSCCKGLKNFAENTILFLLRSVLKAWLTFLCGMGLGLFGILIIGFWPVMGLVLCLAITIALVRGCKWIFSEGLWPLIALPWKTFSMILSYKRSSHLKSDKGYEKLIEGFQDFSIPVENTPRSSSLLIIDKSREGPNHVGYGTCIRLVNGLDALILPTHLVGSDSYVASSRNGNMIALSDFSPLRTPNEKTDFAIYYGPPNWESKLGVKAATVKTARQLSKGPVSFYTFKDGQWTQKGAFISGVDGLFATTLSNTQPGHSGVGFYSGKTIVGIHSGHSIQHNYNKMIIIPDLPGLTCTDLVYESPLAREKLLAQQQMEALDREYQEELKEEERREVAAMKDFEEGLRRKGKKVWADEGYEILPTVPTSSELSVSPPHSPRLNETVAPPTIKTGPKEDHIQPSMPDSSGNIMKDMLEIMLEKINVAAIAEEIKKTASKALEKELQTPQQRRRRGKRGGNNKPKNSENSSKPSTSGTKQPGKPAPPRAFASVEKLNTDIKQKKPKNQGGEKASAVYIPPSKRQHKASDGQKWAPKQNSKV